MSTGLNTCVTVSLGGNRCEKREEHKEERKHEEKHEDKHETCKK